MAGVASPLRRLARCWFTTEAPQRIRPRESASLSRISPSKAVLCQRGGPLASLHFSLKSMGSWVSRVNILGLSFLNCETGTGCQDHLSRLFVPLRTAKAPSIPSNRPVLQGWGPPELPSLLLVLACLRNRSVGKSDNADEDLHKQQCRGMVRPVIRAIFKCSLMINEHGILSPSCNQARRAAGR